MGGASFATFVGLVGVQGRGEEELYSCAFCRGKCYYSFAYDRVRVEAYFPLIANVLSNS